MQKYLLATLMILLFASGCKEDETSRFNLLTLDDWRFTSKTISGVENIDPCEKDDLDTYLANGVFTHKKGADDCSGTQSNVTDTWKLVEGDTKIIFEMTKDTVTVHTLNKNTLRYSYIDEPEVVYNLIH